jgi:cytochrome c-type biogenesis protein CcmE
MAGKSREVSAQVKPPSGRTRFLRRKRFLIVGLAVAVGLGYLGFIAFQGASMYYLTVDELVARGDAAYGEQTRVTGKVVEGSVEEHRETDTLRFEMASEGGIPLPVLYSGVVPDAFKPAADVVVEGNLTPNGTFKADTLLVKCPSKYEGEPEAEAPGERE